MKQQQREIPWKTLHPWMKQAYDWGVKNNGWHIVSPGSEECKAWAAYFAKLGWTPWAFRELGKSVREWTAPTQWPTWLPTEMAT